MRRRTLPPIEYQTLTVLMPVFNEQSTVKEIISRCLLVELPLARRPRDRQRRLERRHRRGCSTGLDDARVTGARPPGATRARAPPCEPGSPRPRATSSSSRTPTWSTTRTTGATLLGPVLEGRAVVVYGNRFAGKGQNMSGLHWLGNRFLSLITSVLYAKRLGDMETCYKLFDRRVLAPIHVVSDRFDFEPEITAKVLRQGYDIVEVPDQLRGPGVPRGQEDHLARRLRRDPRPRALPVHAEPVSPTPRGARASAA